MLKEGNEGAVVDGCDEELDAAAGANDGNGDADGAELAGCELGVEFEGKLNVGAAVIAADVAALLEAGVDWAAPPRLKPEKGAVAGFDADSALDDAGGKLNRDF